uniref:Integrator complex subunit 8 n=1 Tax=Petromyzon marinus TaxID=7757 RepID=A0AAJ7U8G8_PETMA|nr:integrator complex subunit 8 [Petromyzon marinus]
MGVAADVSPPTTWFEFLLDENLLDLHLRKPSPNPSGVVLISLFLEQASKSTVNEQNQAVPPANNKRNRVLKLLALRTAAHLKWDLALLERELSVPVLNMLLDELLAVSRVPPGVSHTELGLAGLPAYTAMAVILYHRWAVRANVQCSFPAKQPKSGPLQPTVMNQLQQEKEMTEAILKVLREQCQDSIAVLEEALLLPDTLCVHTIDTLSRLAVPVPSAAPAAAGAAVTTSSSSSSSSSPAVANGHGDAGSGGEPPGLAEDGGIDAGQGMRVPRDELHCCVCYDLGSVYFMRGSSDFSQYHKARDHFLRAKQLLDKVGVSAACTQVDCTRLGGYWQACSAVLPGDGAACEVSGAVGAHDAALPGSAPRANSYASIQRCLKASDWKSVVDTLLEDNLTQMLPTHYRQSLLRELGQQVQSGSGGAGLEELCARACVCNGVRDLCQGRPAGVSFLQLLQKPSAETIDFLLEVCLRSIKGDQSLDSTRRKNMAQFLKNLCLQLEDLQLVFMVSSHELFMRLLEDGERQALLETMRRRSPTFQPASTRSAFQDIPVTSPSVSVGQLEQQLIVTFDPWRIRQILIELHGLTSDRQFWTVSSKWELLGGYTSCILSMKEDVTRDLLYILMAKALRCLNNRDHSRCRQLLTASLELVADFSPRLRQVVLNELLLLDVRDSGDAPTAAAAAAAPPGVQPQLPGGGGAGGGAPSSLFSSSGGGAPVEQRPRDIIGRARGYLESRQQDVPTRQVIAEGCVCLLLNWKEYEYLALQTSVAALHNPYVKLGQLLAGTCRDVPGPKESRRAAKELWETVVYIFSSGPAQARKQPLEGKGTPLMFRKEFIAFMKKLKETLVLTTLISLLVKLHNVVRDEIVNDVSAEFISLWPSSLPNLQSVDSDAVAVAIKELLAHALAVNPTYPSWLLTQADFYFATNQYSAARQHYLRAGAVASDFFHKAVPQDVYTEQVLKRLIKCCSLLNCHTQAAVLCQFIKELDYPTAFKALQEQNSSDSMDMYYDYIWDVTILEYLIHLHHKRGEADKKQLAVKAMGQTELNSSNPEEVLQLAAQKRKKGFLQLMGRLYF